MEQLHGIFQQDHKKYYKGSRAKIVPQMPHLCIQMQNDHDRCTHDRRRKGCQEAVSDQHDRHHPKVQPSFFSSPEFSQNAVQDPDMQSADCQDMSCPVALKLFQCILFYLRFFAEQYTAHQPCCGLSSGTLQLVQILLLLLKQPPLQRMTFFFYMDSLRGHDPLYPDGFQI